MNSYYELAYVMLVNKLPKSRFFIRFYSTSHLPARNSWKKEFSFVGTKLRGRDTISCLDTAREFVKDVGIQEMGSSTTPVTVIDAYSGMSLIEEKTNNLKGTQVLVWYHKPY